MDGDWHHIAMTWQKGTSNGFVSYLDGTLIDKRDSSNDSIPNINNPVTLAAYNGTREFSKGFLDEVRIWSYARTAEEIKRDKDIRLLGDEYGLEAYSLR